jgi:hypothetical protein
MTRCVAQEWYLSFLVWVPSLGFVAFLVFTLWTGKLYARGPIYLRDKHPVEYWSGVGFLVFMVAVVLALAAESLPCEGWPHF